LAAISSVHGIYHWTDSGVASWYDFAVAIAEDALAAGLLAKPPRITPITTENYQTPARRPRFSVLDKCSTVRAIGIVPRHWRANLRQVLGDIELG
jgi:dTDP-4-dehydrorhamnose reductase